MPTHWQVVYTRIFIAEMSAEQSKAGNYQIHSIRRRMILKVRRYVSIGIVRANEARSARVVQIVTYSEEWRNVWVVQ
jgi:hypothetical protein